MLKRKNSFLFFYSLAKTFFVYEITSMAWLRLKPKWLEMLFNVPKNVFYQTRMLARFARDSRFPFCINKEKVCVNRRVVNIFCFHWPKSGSKPRPELKLTESAENSWINWLCCWIVGKKSRMRNELNIFN